MAYKTANPPPHPSSAAVTAGHQTRFSRGLSEHERFLEGSPIPVTRIGSDPSLARQQQQDAAAPHPEDAEDFQDAMSSHGGGRSARTATGATTAMAPHGAATASASAANTPSAMQGRTGGVVPNGYHFTLGVNSGSRPGGQGAGSLREQEEDDWC